MAQEENVFCKRYHIYILLINCAHIERASQPHSMPVRVLLLRHARLQKPQTTESRGPPGRSLAPRLLVTNITLHIHQKTSQEVRMLSSVTINCQVTKIIMIPGSQLSVLKSQMSQVGNKLKKLKKLRKS